MVTYIFLCAVKVRVGKSCVDFDTDVLLFPEGGKLPTGTQRSISWCCYSCSQNKTIANTIVPFLNTTFAKQPHIYSKVTCMEEVKIWSHGKKQKPQLGKSDFVLYTKCSKQLRQLRYKHMLQFIMLVYIVFPGRNEAITIMVILLKNVL